MLLTAVNRTAPTRVCTRKGRDIVASFVLGVMESEKNKHRIAEGVTFPFMCKRGRYRVTASYSTVRVYITATSTAAK